MKYIKIICFFLITLLVSCSEKESISEAPKKKIFVSTIDAKLITFEDKESAQGTIEGLIDPTIAAEVSGKVIKLYARSGSSIKKGDLLAEIDNADYLYQKNLAEAEIRKLIIRLKNQEKIYARNQKLVDKNFISPNALDNILTDKSETQEELEIAKSRLDIAQSNLSKTKIYSPITGKVEKQIASIGDYLKIGDGVFQIISNRKVRVHIPFPETLSQKIKPGLPILLTSPVSNEPYEAVISELKPMLSEDSRTIDVIADITNSPLWQPGATVRGTIVFKSEKGVAVPEQSIVQRPSGNTVYVVENNIAKSRVVTIGLSQDGYVEILDGVNEGEIVAVDGASFLTNDIEININNKN